MILQLHGIQAQYVPELSFLRFQFRPSAHELTRFKTSLKAVAQLIDQNTLAEGLIDLCGLPNISLEKQLWIATSWLPRVSVASVRHVAFVMPKTGLYNQMVIESLHRAARHFIRYEVQFFSEPTSALDWLLSFQHPAAQAALELEWAQHPLALEASLN